MFGSIILAENINYGLTFFALLVAGLLIILNGIYVAYEFAVVASKKSYFENSKISSKRSSKLALRSLSDISMQLAGAQLGITMASLALGRVGEPALEPLIERLIGSSFSHETATLVSIIIALTIVTFLHLVIGEMVPKNIALSFPEETLKWLAIPYNIYLTIFRPFAVFLNTIANVFCRLIGIVPKDEIMTVHTASELAVIVHESTEQGTIEEDDGALLQDVLAFSEAKVKSALIPIEEVSTGRMGMTVKRFENIVAESGQSRVPIQASTGLEGFIGYIHAKDLLKINKADYSTPLSPDLVRQMAVVDANLPLVEALRIMRSLRRQLSVVTVDGKPIGFISIEVVMEVLVNDQPKFN